MAQTMSLEDAGWSPGGVTGSPPEGMQYTPEAMGQLDAGRKRILADESARGTNPSELADIDRGFAGKKMTDGQVPKPKTMSLADAGYKPAQSWHDQLIGTGASVADFLSGVIGFPLQVLSSFAGDIGVAGYALAHPEENISTRDILGAGSEYAEGIGNAIPFRNLGTKALQTFGKKDGDYSNTVGTGLGMVSEGLKRASDFGEKVTGLPSEGFDQLEGGLQLAGLKMAPKALRAVSARILGKRAKEAGVDPEDNQAFQEFAKKSAQQPPTEAEVNEIKEGLDKHRNAEKTASDLMRRGASNADVKRAIKKNPLVEQKMEALRKKMDDAKAVFDPDFGARGGEVLEPKAPIGQTGLDAEALPAHATVEGSAEAVQATANARAAGALPENAIRTGLKQLPNQGGEVDLRQVGALAAAAGVTAGAYYAYTHPDTQAEIRNAALAIGAAAAVAKVAGKAPGKGTLGTFGLGEGKGPTPTLGEVFADEPYTFKTFERLPQNKSSFGKDQIRNMLKMPGVKAEEKAAVERILAMHGDEDQITAEQLRGGLKIETGDHVLTPEATHKYSNNGLDALGRKPTEVTYGEDLDFTRTDVDPITTLYNVPDHIRVSKNNHFTSDNLFGWTRSFVEGGIRHVIEIQSDLVRNMKAFSAEEGQRIAERRNAIAEELRGKVPGPDNLELRKELLKLSSLLGNRGAAGPLAPLAKNWWKRIVRETMGKAAADLQDTKDYVEAYKKEEAGNSEWDSESEGIQELLRQRGLVRFAAPDTVAIVEGWPRVQKGNTAIQMNLESIEAEERYERTQNVQPTERQLKHRANMRRIAEALKKGEEPFYSEDNQSIYDRYRREITPFLQNELQGKEVTDQHGHTWIEVPVGKRGPTQAYGFADPKLLAVIGLTLGGAYTAATLAQRDKLEAAIVGGMVGAAAAMLPGYMASLRGKWGNLAKNVAVTAGVAAVASQIDSKHPVEGVLLALAWGSTKLLPKASIPMIGKMSIDDVVNLANGAKASVERDAANVARGMITAVPDAGRRAAIAEAVDKGDLTGLNANERKVAAVWQQIAADYGSQAKNEGLIQDLIQNYVSHIVEKTSQPQTMVQQVMAEIFGGPSGVGGMGGKPGFFKPRKYDTFADLQKALQGSSLQIKTMDIAEIAHSYIMGVGKALANKRLVDNLQQAKSGPAALIQQVQKAPQGYVQVNSPQLRGMAVHPDIAPSLKFVMERTDPGAFKNGMLALSMATKRLATGLSYFHAANLMNAYLAANGLDAMGGKNGINAALKVYRNGGQGDVVDLALKNGLKVEAGRPGESDLQAMTKLGALLDHYVNTATGLNQGFTEGALGRFEKFQRKFFDKVTWDYMHTGMKLATFMKKYEKAIAAGEHEKPGMDRDKVAAQVASFVNDTFGGLDWYRVATETESAFGRRMAMSTLSPGARQSLQILMFAPDWTMSTFRAMYKALPNSKQMPLTTKLHQGYVMRTALMYAIFMNGYNLAQSGHPIWQNADYGHSPTRIDNGDGTETQMAKHAMEGVEVLRNPRQAALDKMGFVPKQVMEQLSGREYLRAEGEAPKIKSRVGHLLGSLAPIPMQEATSSGRSGSDKVARWVSSTMGLPKYGITTKERTEMKEKRSSERELRNVKKLLGEDVDE